MRERAAHEDDALRCVESDNKVLIATAVDLLHLLKVWGLRLKGSGLRH